MSDKSRQKPVRNVTRRNFLKSGLAAGAAFTCASSISCSPSAVGPTSAAHAADAGSNVDDGKKRNVILMIADGAGFSSFDITSDYMTGSPRGMIYNGDAWTLLGCSTYSIKGDYEPAKMWKAFENQKDEATDSAAASTSLHTGRKTKNGRIGQDADKNNLLSIAELAHQNGFASGAVTSVGVSHATPGGVVGHGSDRAEGHKLLVGMLDDGNLDVLIGGGHPEFDHNGKPRGEKNKYCKYGPDEEMWKRIRAGALPRGMKFIETREDFQRLARNEDVPEKLLGLAPVTETFQQQRDKNVPRLETSPTLTEASLAGLNILNRNKKGFYLMIEGGAVDWCNHANNLERSVEEMAEFNEAVVAVCAWVEKNSSWDETLLIVTADHDCGGIWGPTADKPATLFQRPILAGKGNLAEAKYFSMDHTNLLVPFYFRGKNADSFLYMVKGVDKKAGELFQFTGHYLDNTDVFPVAKEVFGL